MFGRICSKLVNLVIFASNWSDLVKIGHISRKMVIDKYLFGQTYTIMLYDA